MGDVHRKALEEDLLKLIDILRLCIVKVENFNPRTQETFYKEINDLITYFNNIDRLREHFNFPIPLQLLKYIDQGINPEVYKKQCVDLCLANNQKIKGKIDSIALFRNILEEEIQKTFPEQLAEYKKIKNSC
eukprot:TRINITY_DN6238_c0_g1_i1.p1 TRINITY_DN6238_c0_g1~~TRINITY_DN6238_c0_g1_i1.p1  ORF type:complete len:143 (-),score=26.88 TRINITY_DN6238_c0_g1_i1:93-488(-)